VFALEAQHFLSFHKGKIRICIELMANNCISVCIVCPNRKRIPWNLDWWDFKCSRKK